MRNLLRWLLGMALAWQGMPHTAQQAFAEELVWQGDPGEGVAQDALQADLDADGKAEAWRGERRQDVQLCGEGGLHHPLLNAEQQLADGRWQAQPLPLAQQLKPAAAETPTPLVVQPAASPPDAGAMPWLQPVASGQLREGSFLTALWPGGSFHAVRAVGLTLRGSSSGWLLVGDVGPALAFRLPLHAPKAKHQRVRIEFPEPQPWRCISLVGPPGALIEVVQVASDLDDPAAMASLVEQFQAGGDAAANAETLLRTAGATALPAVEAAWPRLSASSQQRAIGWLASLAPQNAASRALLLQASLAKDEGIAMPAWRDLYQAGESARAEIAQRCTVADAIGDRAASSLARWPDSTTQATLLRALEAPGGSQRPALRAALRRSSRDDAAALAAYASWHAGAGVTARAAALLALAGSSPAWTEALTGAWLDTWPHASRFEERWWLCLASMQLPASAAIDAALRTLSAPTVPWMLQAKALDALHHRASPLAANAARQALHAAYPRVRVRAAQLATGDPQARERLRSLAQHDPWPMVRQAAAQALQTSRGSSS